MTNFINRVLLNQYHLDAFIASGGMGVAYRVWDLKRKVPLAMKVLRSEFANNPHKLKRLQHEGWRE